MQVKQIVNHLYQRGEAVKGPLRNEWPRSPFKVIQKYFPDICCTEQTNSHQPWSLSHFFSGAIAVTFLLEIKQTHQKTCCSLLNDVLTGIDSQDALATILCCVVTLICKNNHLNHLLFLHCLPASLFFNNFPRLFIFLCG